ncbi:uncharacterized protein LOC121756892 [Salvia splendens]|uniref:uncharacterized protein LOC121756892 n=1 Tax=Salvia splendens TaxID=180675 RepID=UPI001C260F07|nr:uncharacterized protein LOC121756892 [Salvia splendens]
MMQVIQKRKVQPAEGINRFRQTLLSQVGGDNNDAISKEHMALTREFNRLKGEELEELDMNELARLERVVESALGRVAKKVYVRDQQAGDKGNRTGERKCDAETAS